MIKQIEIPAIFEQNLYCDECGTAMHHCGFRLNEHGGTIFRYRYRCPKCKNVAESKEKYPKFLSGYEDKMDEVVQAKGYILEAQEEQNDP